MPWSELEDSDGHGHKSMYHGHEFEARLDFDCHGDPRKLEVRPTTGSLFAASLLEHLKPFAEPVVVVPGQLAIVDRPGYFRLYISPSRLQAQLRKDAPLSVVGELLTQVERAQTATTCATCPSVCLTGALAYGQADCRLQIDSRRCTHCLDCVRHHLDAGRVPSASAPRAVAPTASRLPE